MNYANLSSTTVCVIVVRSPELAFSPLRDWSLITGRGGGATKLTVLNGGGGGREQKVSTV